MNYRVNTEMIPRYSSLRVCLSCWSKLPCVVRSPAKWAVTGQHFPVPVCSQNCGMRWSLATLSKQYSTKKTEFDIAENPYFEKYKAKLDELKSADPVLYEEKLKEMQAREKANLEKLKKEFVKPPEKPKSETEDSRLPSGSWPPDSLNEIMKVELLKDKSPEEIELIWKEYHVTKDCVFGIVKGMEYDSLKTKAHVYPFFIYPLPRNDGYEFILSQINGRNAYFTPLGLYQTLKENAPPCLTIAHFPELKEEKGIVLMVGQYDDKILTKNESLNLVKQMSVYYGQSAGENFNLVRMFNQLPEKFDYLDLIENYKSMKQSLENYYT